MTLLRNLLLGAARRSSDRAPLAERVRLEHDADLGAIRRQAELRFAARHSLPLQERAA